MAPLQGVMEGSVKDREVGTSGVVGLHPLFELAQLLGRDKPKGSGAWRRAMDQRAAG